MISFAIEDCDKARQDGEIVGLEHYTSEEEGVTVDMYSGVVQNVFLYPRKAEDGMRCKPTGKMEARAERDRS
jgi:hypothetical protein